jgi:hypothetical protein
VQIVGCTVHDIGYAGIHHFSALTVREMYNTVYGIAPGISANAYGISHTHDSTNYNTDPLVGATITGITAAASAVVTISTVSGSNPFAVNQSASFAGVGGMTQINGLTGTVTAIGGSSGAWTVTVNINSSTFSAYTSGGLLSCPRQATNPFCIDMDCAFNVVYDVPLWSAFDAHGCYEGRYHHNVSYNCHRGFQISSSSGAANNYAGENNRIESNVIYSQQINGNVTTDTNGYQAGIVVNGGSTVSHRNVYVRDNVLIGMGHASATPTVYCIETSLCNGLEVIGNTFRACVGRGLSMNNTTNGVIADNEFDSMGASSTGGICMFIDNNCSALMIRNNLMNPATGTLTTYPTGISFPGSGYGRVTFIGNDFSACTAPYGTFNGTFVKGNSDLTPQINDTTTGSHTIDVSVVGPAPRFFIQASQGSAATLTSLLNPSIQGQECTIIMSGGSTLTVNNTGNIQLQGGTCALTSQSTLTLVWSSSLAKWQERSRALGNT